MLYDILKQTIIHQITKLCNSFTETRSCCTLVYKLGVISKNDKFQKIDFHSCSCLNLFTSSNNRYVPLRQGHQMCAEA